jgi:hypothetical protein
VEAHGRKWEDYSHDTGIDLKDDKLVNKDFIVSDNPILDIYNNPEVRIL